jgi:hypothetical protein
MARARNRRDPPVGQTHPAARQDYAGLKQMCKDAISQNARSLHILEPASISDYRRFP